MIDLDEAWRRLDDLVQPLAPEQAAPWNARGRRIVHDVRSPCDLPRFDNSAMDGYALHSSDVAAATENAAVALPVVTSTYAGDQPAQPLEHGTAHRIMTGAVLPDEADCVLRLEDALLRDDVVTIRTPVAAGRHVRHRGEDVRTGDELVPAGAVLSPGDIALLASAGIDTVTVGAMPRVSVLVTGSELVPPGSTPGPGAIHDSNGPLLLTLAQSSGVSVTNLGIAPDDRDELRAMVAEAVRDTDVLVISGGVSVGRRDYVKQVVEDIGAERIFWRVSMKPGKPLLAARTPSGCIILGLPGNPVSVLAGWTMFVAPVLDRLAGATHPLRPWARHARLAAPATGDAGRVVLATARSEAASDGSVQVQLTRSQGSSMMRSMSDGNCFVRIDPGAALAAHDIVETYPWATL